MGGGGGGGGGLETPQANRISIPITIHLTVKFLNFRTPENFAVIYLNSNKEAKPIDISA